MKNNYTKWKTLNGEVLKIKDMEVSHIKNCIEMLQARIPFYEEIKEDIICNGVYGFEYALMEVEEMIDFTKSYISVFKQELRNRGVAEQ